MENLEFYESQIKNIREIYHKNPEKFFEGLNYLLAEGSPEKISEIKANILNAFPQGVVRSAFVRFSEKNFPGIISKLGIVDEYAGVF